MEIKLNSGSIFKNDYKEKEAHPDYKGKINVDGKVKDIALWVNKPDGGKPYFGVKISEPYVKDENNVETPPPEDDQDLPF